MFYSDVLCNNYIGAFSCEIMWNLKLLDKFCRSTKPINFHKSPSIISVELYIASWHRKINYSAVVDMDDIYVDMLNWQIFYLFVYNILNQNCCWYADEKIMEKFVWNLSLYYYKNYCIFSISNRKPIGRYNIVYMYLLIKYRSVWKRTVYHLVEACYSTLTPPQKKK